MCPTCESRFRRAHHRGPCKTCGRVFFLQGGLCPRDAQKQQHERWPLGTCPRCRERRRLGPSGRCESCRIHLWQQRAVRIRLDALFGAPPRTQQLAALDRHLTRDLHPHNVRDWAKHLAPEICAFLAHVGEGGVTRERLEEFRRLRGGRELWDSCERCGLFAPPPPDIARIERFVAAVSAKAPSWIGSVLRAYWQLGRQRRARERVSAGGDPTLTYERAALRDAFGFLTYLAARNLRLADLDQLLLDRWLRTRSRRQAQALAPFLRWLIANGDVTNTLALPPCLLSRGEAVSPPAFYALVARAIEDKRVELRARVAVLLCALCTRPIVELCRLRVSDIRTLEDDRIEVCFHKGVSQWLEGDAARLVRELARESTAWLFGSCRAGQALTPVGLRHLIARAGFDAGVRKLLNASVYYQLRELAPGELMVLLGRAPNGAITWGQRVGQSRGFVPLTMRGA